MPVDRQGAEVRFNVARADPVRIEFVVPTDGKKSTDRAMNAGFRLAPSGFAFQ